MGGGGTKHINMQERVFYPSEHFSIIVFKNNYTVSMLKGSKKDLYVQLFYQQAGLCHSDQQT